MRTVVHVYENGKAYEVEFLTLNGETVTVTTLEGYRLRPIEPCEIYMWYTLPHGANVE